MKKIYILHGWAYSTEKWEPFVKILKDKGFEIVLLEIPGLTAPLKNVWNLDDYVTWLAKVLEKEKQVILLGHSNGGRMSLAFALKYPEKVKQIILIDSAGIYHNEFSLRLKRFVFGRAAKFGKLVTKSKNLRALLYKFSREHDYEKADPIVRETMLNLIRADLTDNLSQISKPITIIWGASDKVTPVSDGKLMHEKMKDSSLHQITGARHSPMFTHPHEVADIIEKEL